MNKKLFEFIKSSPTAYHAVSEAGRILADLGYTELFENKEQDITPGGKYFVVRGASSLIAFRIPKSGVKSFMITASHGDSPALKIKDNAELDGAGVTRLSSEKYGGMLLATWFDRPLSVAGRVCVKTPKGLEIRLVDTKKPSAVIPSVAIHMNPKANSGAGYDPAVDVVPVYCTGKANGSFKKEIARCAECAAEDIISTDLFLYNPQPGCEAGGMIISPRLDDLQCAFAALTAFTRSEEGDEGEAVPVYCLFDNEEVGSTTKQGAASTFLHDVLKMIADSSGLDGGGYRRAVADSFMVSCDNAHAVHPNHPELCDKNHAVYMNGGIVIKFNANQKYTSDAISSGIFKMVCDEAGVPYQSYANRADMPGGSTLGNIANTHVSLNTVDVGLAQLAMHSAMETAGADDTKYMVRALGAFYKKSLRRERNAYYLI